MDLLKRNIYIMFSSLIEHEYNAGEKIANFFIIPIYDREFSDIFACLLDFDYIRRILEHKKISDGIVSGILDQLRITKIINESEAHIIASLGAGSYLTANEFLSEYRQRYKKILEHFFQKTE
ncbi:MAG: hypothetical protein Q6363_008270 [Candidatus Njordarchaeota archaeon]